MKKILLLLLLCSCKKEQTAECGKVYVINEKKTRQNILIKKDTVNTLKTCSEPSLRKDTVYFWDYYIISYSKR